MRKKYFLIIFLGTLACMLLLDDLVVQPLVSHDSSLVYAMGPRPGPRPRPCPDPIPVPEPSTLILLGTGITCMGAYLYYKHRKNKKQTIGLKIVPFRNRIANAMRNSNTVQDLEVSSSILGIFDPPKRTLFLLRKGKKAAHIAAFFIVSNIEYGVLQSYILHPFLMPHPKPDLKPLFIEIRNTVNCTSIIAIWRIEEEFGNPDVSNFVYNGYGFLGDAILTQANEYYTLSLQHSNFIGNIMVLNLYDDSNTLKQSQLRRVPRPVPEPST